MNKEKVLIFYLKMIINFYFKILFKKSFKWKIILTKIRKKKKKKIT